MLVHERAALLRVALEARFVFAQESEPASLKFLLNVRRRALDRDTFVHLMTIGAAHLAFEHGMVMGQREGCAYFQVTLETCFRRFARIYDGTGAASSLDVQTSRPVARLASHVRRLL